MHYNATDRRLITLRVYKQLILENEKLILALGGSPLSLVVQEVHTIAKVIRPGDEVFWIYCFHRLRRLLCRTIRCLHNDDTNWKRRDYPLLSHNKGHSTLTFWTFSPVLGFNNARVLGASFELGVNYKSLEVLTPLLPSGAVNNSEMIMSLDLCHLVRFAMDLQRCLLSIYVWNVTSTSSGDLPCHFINSVGYATGLFFII